MLDVSTVYNILKVTETKLLPLSNAIWISHYTIATIYIVANGFVHNTFWEFIFDKYN